MKTGRNGEKWTGECRRAVDILHVVAPYIQVARQEMASDNERQVDCAMAFLAHQLSK
jgi:hypothetical protein